MITVGELIERLEEMPPELPVQIVNRGGKPLVKEVLLRVRRVHTTQGLVVRITI